MDICQDCLVTVSANRGGSMLHVAALLANMSVGDRCSSLVIHVPY